MKTLIIRRVATGEHGTFGVLVYENNPFALTLEREWLDNQRMISCIPAGTYICKRVNSPKFGNTFEVTKVENRTHILFHKGNLEDDSHGCVLVGETFSDINEAPGIGASKKGYTEFMSILTHDEEFRLIIVAD